MTFWNIDSNLLLSCSGSVKLSLIQENQIRKLFFGHDFMKFIFNSLNKPSSKFVSSERLFATLFSAGLCWVPDQRLPGSWLQAACLQSRHPQSPQSGARTQSLVLIRPVKLILLWFFVKNTYFWFLTQIKDWEFRNSDSSIFQSLKNLNRKALRGSWVPRALWVQCLNEPCS